VPVVGCSTAGEIGRGGYTDATVVAVGFPASHFAATPHLFANLRRAAPHELAAQVLEQRQAVASEAPEWPHEFAFLMVDGMSLMEDRLVAALRPALGTVPLFGGSAGDGIRFSRTLVFQGDRALEDAAALVILRTRCPVRVFSLDHFRPTDRHMVVTRADPERRLVSEINAEPAAREYARIVGKGRDQLSPQIFAAHPVVVRHGGEHHVRAIQKVELNGDLRFYSAIDEGLILTVAEPMPMVAHLEAALGELSRPREPDAIVVCDCILRRLELGQMQLQRQVSAVFARHRAIGFSTYGEQYNNLHVNQTLTGVAIYPPDE
jgi:hypothetical protein